MVRRLLGFDIKGIAPDLGVYVASYYCPKPMVFTPFLNSTFRILRSMAEGVRKSLQEGGRDLYGLCAGPGPG